MGDIHFSFGIPKTASTFGWALIKRIAILGGLDVRPLTSFAKGGHHREDYIDPVTEETLARVQEEIGDGCAVIKTHGGGGTTIAARMVRENRSKVFISYRDLRDVSLSLIDHGARARKVGIKDHTDILKPEDALPLIKVGLERMDSWVRDCAPLMIPYNEICFDTPTTIRRVADRFGVAVSVGEVMDGFKHKEKDIGQFNKGVIDRYKTEMNDNTSELFLKTFRSYYEKYFPEALEVELAGTGPERNLLR